jgi:hypothetical protein
MVLDTNSNYCTIRHLVFYNISPYGTESDTDTRIAHTDSISLKLPRAVSRVLARWNK